MSGASVQIKTSCFKIHARDTSTVWDLGKIATGTRVLGLARCLSVFFTVNKSAVFICIWVCSLPQT